jgi:hypothetical protein
MKASIILQRAKARMQAEEWTSPYICDNVWHVTKGEPYGNRDERRITKFITELLGGRFSLVEWLIDMGHIEVNMSGWSYGNTQYLGNIDKAKLQATRMAWLDYLIGYYEAKGD